MAPQVQESTAVVDTYHMYSLSKEFHQGVLFKGQIYDAFKLIREIIHS